MSRQSNILSCTLDFTARSSRPSSTKTLAPCPTRTLGPRGISCMSLSRTPSKPHSPQWQLYLPQRISCSQALDDHLIGQRPLKVSYGTTKYCTSFLKNYPCTNERECFYLHNWDIDNQLPAEDNVKTVFSKQLRMAMQVVADDLDTIAERVRIQRTRMKARKNNQISKALEYFPSIVSAVHRLYECGVISDERLDDFLADCNFSSIFMYSAGGDDYSSSESGSDESCSQCSRSSCSHNYCSSQSRRSSISSQTSQTIPVEPDQQLKQSAKTSVQIQPSTADNKTKSISTSCSPLKQDWTVASQPASMTTAQPPLPAQTPQTLNASQSTPHQAAESTATVQKIIETFISKTIKRQQGKQCKSRFAFAQHCRGGPNKFEEDSDKNVKCYIEQYIHTRRTLMPSMS